MTYLVGLFLTYVDQGGGYGSPRTPPTGDDIKFALIVAGAFFATLILIAYIFV